MAAAAMDVPSVATVFAVLWSERTTKHAKMQMPKRMIEVDPEIRAKG